MIWCVRKPFRDVRSASRKSFIDVLGFSFFFASFAVQTQALAALAPSCASPAALNVASAYSDGGFAYMIRGSYGTADKVGSYTQSMLRVFENGREIGPAHSWHADIRVAGRGRFSHWSSTNGSGEALRISASDNTDVRRNGKGYSYCMGATSPVATTPARAPVPAPPAPAPAPPPLVLKAYFVAPGGSDSSAGTQAAPFATLQKAHDVAVAGDTIYMRGGTYRFSAQTNITRSGSSAKRIKVWAYPGETPVIDAINQPSGTQAVLRMTNASWWHIKGIEIKNGAIQGIHASGNSGNNIFEQLNIHHTGRAANGGGTGTALAIYGTGGNNLILNNDVHDNEDQLSFGGGANGINLVTSGAGNVIRGNRAWCNSDDGLDMWNAAPALIENNWIRDSGRGINCRATGGNGNGFKLGGTYTPGRDGTEEDGGHTVINNLSWNNKVDGFHENGGKLPMKLYNNTAYNNGRNSFTFFNAATIFRNNLSHGKPGRIPGTQPYSSWSLPVTVSNADFVSLDDACTRGPRQADGSLPNCSFLRLVSGSDLIDRGVNVGLPYSGAAPDLGAGER